MIELKVNNVSKIFQCGWQISLALLLFTLGCKNETAIHNNIKQEYLRHIGDIEFDAAKDDVNFQLCHEDQFALQYFNFSKGFQYDGEKHNILEHLNKHYQPTISEKNSGYLRIRFIVNCMGEAGRFRHISANYKYEEKVFDKAVVNQLLQLTKELSGWPIMKEEDQPRDYYQYLIYKLDKGKIIDVLP